MMSEMRLNGLKDNVAAHTNLLKGVRIVGRSDDAANHLKELISLGLKPDVKAYAVVIHDYCKLGKPSKAIVFLDEMKSRGMNPHVSCFNSLFRALCDLGEHDRAIHYLKEMPQRESFSVFVEKIRGNGKASEVKKLFEEMRKRCPVPDVDSYRMWQSISAKNGTTYLTIGVLV
ncbi:hypothetical protein IFM89_010453 [Coptis chinensis]|uniref:Pentatricopeptide repeat-containing protein n=1 Tax=Coptis chinensis TaxID=261450 RepID=A0A835I105_9MAGN|nr:hypothetical protein IFM89_010453 [Coptis chinensis]